MGEIKFPKNVIFILVFRFTGFTQFIEYLSFSDAADKANKSKDVQETETSLKNWLRRARDRQNKNS